MDLLKPASRPPCLARRLGPATIIAKVRPMKLIPPALGLTLALAAAAQAHAAPQVSGAWSRPAVAGSTGAGFMTLTNPGKTADALVAVESPAAKRTEIHRSSMAGGIMKMERQDRVALAPGARVTFAPGGYHLMFMGLTRALKTGDRVPATLVFASGAKLSAEFEVRVAPPAGHAHH